METINSVNEIMEKIQNEKMVLAYMTTGDCNICKDLYPKIQNMLLKFPAINGVRAELDVETKLVGQYNVFMVPTIILFIEGKETIRRSRTVSIGELTDAIERYYDMVFRLNEE